MRKISIEELHAKLLDIAKAFHQICERHQIPYYMVGGTMLGAIRHKAIIPWDDDMDFGVPREYFDRLRNILQEELPKNMYVADIDNSKRIITDTYKIVLKNTILKDGGEPPWGIFVDIFPLDHASLNTSAFSRNWFIYLLVKYSVYSFPEKSNSRLRDVLSRVVSCINPFSKTEIVNFTRRVILGGNHGQCEAMVNHVGFWGIKKELMDRNIFGSPVLYQVGDTNLYGVEHPHEYLEHLYGDYMKLPPVEKRHVHCEGVWADVNE